MIQYDIMKTIELLEIFLPKHCVVIKVRLIMNYIQMILVSIKIYVGVPLKQFQQIVFAKKNT